MASIALICMALHAGISPAIKPLISSTPAAATAVWMFTPGFSKVGSFVGLADNILSSKSKKKTPALNPSKPAKAVSTKLSLMTCEMMSNGLAPKALVRLSPSCALLPLPS